MHVTSERESISHVEGVKEGDVMHGGDGVLCEGESVQRKHQALALPVTAASACIGLNESVPSCKV